MNLDDLEKAKTNREIVFNKLFIEAYSFKSKWHPKTKFHYIYPRGGLSEQLRHKIGYLIK